jgi:hypothetical protein
MATLPKIDLNIVPDKSLSLFTGEAVPPFKIREGINVIGAIGVPVAHLEKTTRTQLDYLDGQSDFKSIDLKQGSLDVLSESYVCIDRSQMTVVFVENAGKPYESRYTGKLSLHPDFEKWQINTDSALTPLQLAQFIKMNRSSFENRTEAMKLVTTLMGFEAKVNKEVEAKLMITLEKQATLMVVDNESPKH